MDLDAFTNIEQSVHFIESKSSTLWKTRKHAASQLMIHNVIVSITGYCKKFYALL